MEKNSNKGLKKLVLLLLLFVGLGASVTAGAYWLESFTVNPPTQGTGEVEVTVGVGGEVTVSTNLDDVDVDGDTDVLIPSTITPSTGETIEKSFIVTATWGITETAGSIGVVQGDITQNGIIEYSNVVIEGSTLEDGDDKLFHVDITLENSGEIELFGTNAITVKVTMDEPLSEAQYLRVKNAVITITFTLSITVGE